MSRYEPRRGNTSQAGAFPCDGAHALRKSPCVAAFFIATGCATTSEAVSQPEFSQRAASRPGQDEIELLAGLRGRLAIQDGCLGVTAIRGDDDESFTTIVWPWNARLELSGAGWRVVNVQTGASIEVGQTISGSGGFGGNPDSAELRAFNRYLARDLSVRCAVKGFFTLNRDFRPG